MGMDGDNSGDFPAEINTEAALEQALQQIIVEADSNEVDVCGGWPIRTESDPVADFDVEIVELDPVE